MRRSSSLAGVVAVVSLVPLGAAQTATTSLRGTVTDPSGAAVPGATITLTNKANQQQLSATSGANGEYHLQQITPSTYTITVNAAGFGAQTKSAELLVDQPATINFAVTVNTVSEVVDVSAAAQTINTSDAALGSSTSNATIQALPDETRNIPDLLALNPGVFFIPVPAGSNPAQQDSRSGAVNGGRSDQTNVTLDGVDDNDQIRGLAFTGVLRLTQDATDEFRVTTSNANADAGRSSGAQVSLITKSGTNSFHGAAYEYFRPSNTVANDFFLKQSQLASGQANRPPKLIRNIFGGDVGGPIIKDKLFFFGNYEGERQAESAVVEEFAPTALFQQGVLQYTGASGTTVAVTPAQLSQLDASCSVCKTAAYPAGPGANPNVLALLQSYPTANGTALGDQLNIGSYTFSSPHPIRQNATIARIDWVPGNKHRVFWRGNLQKDVTAGTENFPGQGPSSVQEDNSKGFTVGDTWSITQNLINDARYGYVFQGYGQSGLGHGDYVDFRFTPSNALSSLTAETRNTIISVPVNNIVDNLNWQRGKHDIQVGGNWRLIHQNRSTDANSFSEGDTDPYWVGGTPPDPAAIGLDGVASSFSTSYLFAYSNLVGNVPLVTNNYNYAVSSATAGTLLPEGAFVNRHFKANEFEYYLQDSWRVTPKLTLTYGIRHTILETPWETNGQQVAPTIDTHAWFTQREVSATQGQIYEPDLSFAPSGAYYGKPGFWPKSKNNVAPRVALAYSPDSKTSVRAGAGIYYDHFGEGLVNQFDQRGSFGLSSQIQNPASKYTLSTSPRFTGRQSLPFSNGTPANPQAFPYEPPNDALQITYGIDNRLKTPYSEVFDFSIERQIGGGFTLETAYVGRLGRHLLQSLDLAEPVDFTDPQGSGDYFTAAAQLTAQADQHGNDPTATVATIPYFEHVFPYAANTDYAGETATQAIYANEIAPGRLGLGGTETLYDLDAPPSAGSSCGSVYTGVAYNCPAGNGGHSRFWQDQFSSLYALSTIGMSYYNAFEVSLRHPMSHGLQADINYTFSKSIDMGSDAERAGVFGSSTGTSSGASAIINTWKPSLNRAVSDFDTRHILTVDYVYQLPVGQGKALLRGSNHLVDAVLGGWQLTGILRATSGLPFSLGTPGYDTDWELTSYGIITDKKAARVQKHFDSAGNPQFFANPDAIENGVITGGPVRLPYPGEVGERNNLRGDGYFSLDSGVDKAWKISEYGAVKFAWEVYNTTNTVRFDPFSINPTLTSGSSFGLASSLLTQPRRMQFSLRYDF